MFGHDWDRAEATIVARDAKFSGSGSTANYTFVADVRLVSGEIFRATVHEPTIATDFWEPSIGDTVSVLVRPKDRKVKFDKDDERLSAKAFLAAKKAAFESAQHQPPGSPPAAWAAAAELPDAVLQKLAQLGITGSTSMQVVSGDSVEGQAALAAFTGLAAAHPPVESTTEVRLAELERLHERDLLTAEEYADQRARILDGI